jgi:hypothetical protein
LYADRSVAACVRFVRVHSKGDLMQTPISLRFVQFFLLVLVGSSFLFPQNRPPASDPQAVSFTSQAVAALTGGQAVRDVTLTGSVTWSGGATPETGPAMLKALGTGESRMDLTLPSGTRTEIRDASTGLAQGKWIAQNGSSGLFASQNCFTDAVWFFPVLSSLSAVPNVVFSYIGQETWNGAQVQHIQSYVYQRSQNGSDGPTAQQLSTMDFYLDANTLLPVAVIYNLHPDDNASANILTEVDFSNYQAISGITLPLHIQQYRQGTLIIDLIISNAAFNTGLTDSAFAIN